EEQQTAPPKPNTKWNGECISCRRFPQLSKALPASWDWVEHGAVTPVKSQGGCGGCCGKGGQAKDAAASVRSCERVRRTGGGIPRNGIVPQQRARRSR
ncbi:MAG: C1 family peptidase, partial [Pseudomonadota bacterium]|nr:C1 family peptidase [Pseudomonadota bacterium]